MLRSGRAVKRLMLIVCVAGLWAGAGSAVFASSAMAGGPIESTGIYAAGIYDLTPYPWTLVESSTPELGRCANTGTTCWDKAPAQTIAPGAAMIYQVKPNFASGDGRVLAEYGYDAWMTYRVDILGGPPEYVTVAISQLACFGFDGDCIPALRQFITSTPPPKSYDPGPNPEAAPAPLIAKPQLTFASGPTPWDLTYAPTGEWTIDASTADGASFARLLNQYCGTNTAACTFAQHGPITYGIGDPGRPYAATNCTGGAAAKSAGSTTTQDEPNYFTVEYEASQAASLTVGGGVTASTELKLLGVVGNEVSVSVEAEHEWEEIKSITRETKIFIPSNDIGFVWVIPVVGKVTGTLTVSAGAATFKVTNFSESRSGVSQDPLTPAYNVITKVRPMTAAERKDHCGSASPSPSLGGSRGMPPAQLAPGRGVAGVQLGETQAQVEEALGSPLARRFVATPCQGLGSRCDAAAGTGGRWIYRQLSVVFAPDLRVSALVYGGAERTDKGVGVGSGLAAVRRAYPRLSCSDSARAQTCALTRTSKGTAIKTVFRFVRRRAGRYTCHRIVIYALGTHPGEVKP